MTIEFTIEAEAHCDGPCGVYDPASARVAGEAVQSMTKEDDRTCREPRWRMWNSSIHQHNEQICSNQRRRSTEVQG